MESCSTSLIIRGMHSHHSQDGHHQHVCRQYVLERLWRKRGPPTLAVGMYVGTTTVESCTELHKKLRATIPSSNPTPGHMSKKNWFEKVHTLLKSIAVLFMAAKTWRWPPWPWTEKWVKKTQYTYTMEYHSAITKNKIMPFAATQLDREIIIPHEVKADKDQYHVIPLTWRI